VASDLNLHKGCDAGGLSKYLTSEAARRGFGTRKSAAIETKNLRPALRGLHVAIESFRLAPLLSAGAVILSERCDAVDEEAYAGLVHFDHAADISSTFARVWVERDSIASASSRAATFERRFAPSRLFKQSGAYEALVAHRAALGARAGHLLHPASWCTVLMGRDKCRAAGVDIVLHRDRTLRRPTRL
jgi:hypothetical protein